MDSPVLIFAIVAVVVVALGILGALQAQRRRDAMRGWAKARGLTFDRGRGGIEHRFPRFSKLRQGSNRYAHNIMSGALEGRPWMGFDYHYETHSTDSKGRRHTHHHRFSAVIVGSDVPLQPLFIRPEGFFDRVTEFFGMDDIDFESAEFSRKFYVKADDRKWAFDVIHARTMEFLLGMPHFTVQFDRHHVIAHRSGRFGLDEFEQADQVVRGILERLPNYLIEQQRAAAAHLGEG